MGPKDPLHSLSLFLNHFQGFPIFNPSHRRSGLQPLCAILFADIRWRKHCGGESFDYLTCSDEAQSLALAFCRLKLDLQICFFILGVGEPPPPSTVPNLLFPRALQGYTGLRGALNLSPAEMRLACVNHEMQV